MRTRPATRKDSKALWIIRNLPHTRSASQNEAPFPFEAHDPWYGEQYFAPHTRNRCFVLESEPGKVVGYCRYDEDPTKPHLVVSIALDTDHLGQGLGHQLLSESLALLAPSSPVHATVQKSNKASAKLFLKNHFLLYDEDENYLYLAYTPR